MYMNHVTRLRTYLVRREHKRTRLLGLVCFDVLLYVLLYGIYDALGSIMYAIYNINIVKAYKSEKQTHKQTNTKLRLT